MIRDNLLEDLVRYRGLWQSEFDADTNLSLLKSNCQQILALKTQTKERLPGVFYTFERIEDL